MFASAFPGARAVSELVVQFLKACTYGLPVLVVGLLVGLAIASVAVYKHLGFCGRFPYVESFYSDEQRKQTEELARRARDCGRDGSGWHRCLRGEIWAPVPFKRRALLVVCLGWGERMVSYVRGAHEGALECDALQRTRRGDGRAAGGGPGSCHAVEHSGSICGRSRSAVPGERVDKMSNGIRVSCGVCGLHPCRCGIHPAGVDDLLYPVHSRCRCCSFDLGLPALRSVEGALGCPECVLGARMDGALQSRRASFRSLSSGPLRQSCAMPFPPAPAHRPGPLDGDRRRPARDEVSRCIRCGPPAEPPVPALRGAPRRAMCVRLANSGTSRARQLRAGAHGYTLRIVNRRHSAPGTTRGDRCAKPEGASAPTPSWTGS